MMDTKFPTIIKESMNDFHGMSLNDDVSLLRQPMRTALTGFLEAKKAYENGTDEVRRLLLHECSLLYECNVCRNMFRSLVNFISHKRIYCKLSSEGNYRPYSDHISSVIIQTTEQCAEPRFNKSRSTGSSPVPTKPLSRDLSKVIERLRRVDVSAEQSKEQPHPSQRQTKQTPFALQQQQQPDITQQPDTQDQEPDPILHLESVPTSTQAVYQTLKPLHASDSIRTEVDEVHNLLTNQNTMIGPDGKAIVNHSFFTSPTVTSALEGIADEMPSLSALVGPLSQMNQSGNVLQQQPPQISCEICQMPFQTEKTLNIHIQKKHSSSTYVFQCPTCSLTFLQPAAVIRHLANEHKKPLKRIRKMRDSILKKRVQIGDVQVKGPSRELKGLQLDSTKDLENANGGNVMPQQNGKPVSTCNFCQKTFERRAAFATHLANCPTKKSPMTKNEVQSKIRVATKEEIQTKLKIQNSTTLAKVITEDQKDEGENEIKSVGQRPANPENEQDMADYHYEYTSNHLNKVNIKQEPQDDEFNSNSTHATTGSDINEMFENLGKQTFGEGLQTVSLDLMVSTEQDSAADEEEEEEPSTEKDKVRETIKEELTELKREVEREDVVEEPLPSSPENEGEKKKQKGFRTVPASKQLTCRCKICNKQFNALSNLRRHISMFHYRARRFGCNLCDYRAFRRYDIVNHLSFVHKMIGERESMAVEFVTMHDIQYSKDDVEHDIVVVNDVAENLSILQENGVKTYENKGKRKKPATEEKADVEPTEAEAPVSTPETNLTKVVRRKLRKALAQEVDSGQRRPIRNRIKTVNNDFVYDLSNLKEEPKDPTTRLALKRRNTMGMTDNKHSVSSELSPPIKITPYRLRTEPLIPANKELIKGFATRTYRNVVQEALAAPSTLPELPTERPLMRPRLSLPCRSDPNNAPVIEATELEVARLESTFFDDSFLEKFAKKANPSFKMKPLLALQHSPLNSILQKFENNSNKILNTDDSATNPQENGVVNPPEKVTTLSSPPLPPQDHTENPLESLSEQILQQMDNSPPNGTHIMEPSSPPSTPRKRITLMQRLAENRAKRRDPLLRSALEN